MKLYTKTGDDGTTGLSGSRRVAKDSLVIEVVGSLDELNSHVGLASSACSHRVLSTRLTATQRQLFEIGASVAACEERSAATSPLEAGAISRIEQDIDAFCRPLEPLRHFVLPGGSELGARLHAARSICRRCERLCVALGKQTPLNREILVYLNRLSDLLFAMARRANQLEGVADVLWKGEGQ